VLDTLEAMQLSRTAAHSLALHKPLMLLVALSLLEADGAQRSWRPSELAPPLRAVWATYSGSPAAADAALACFELAGEPFWKIAGGRPASPAALRGQDSAAHLHPAKLGELVATDRAARLDLAEAVVARWWPPAVGPQLLEALALRRTYRLVVLAPGQLEACLANGTWGVQSYVELNGWRCGDGLLVHVTQAGELRATAIATRDPHEAHTSWQNTDRKRHPRQIAFRVTARLAPGVSTKRALEPVRRGAPENWFKGFLAASHALEAADAAALLAAVEDALAASA
jgi:hypothetical protein